MWFTRGRVRELKNGHNSVTVQNRKHVYMNFFHHKDLGNHLLQLCPKVVKHPVCTLPALFWLLTFQVISVPSNATRHYGGAGFLCCEAVVPGAAVKGTFLWRCVYDVSLRHFSCRLVSPSAGQINWMSLPKSVGRYVPSTTLLQREVECRGVCQRVFMWELQLEPSIFSGFPPGNGSYKCRRSVGNYTASHPRTSDLE